MLRRYTSHFNGAMYSEVATDLVHFLNSSCSHFSASGNTYVTAHGKTYVNDLRKHSLKSFVDRSLVVRNFYPFVKSF